MSYNVQNISKLSRAIREKHKHVILSYLHDTCLKMAVNKEDFPWHYHPNSDELFIMMEGELAIDFEDGRSVTLRPKDVLLVPAQTVHRSRPAGRTVNLLVERSDIQTIFVEAPVDQGEKK